MYQLSTVRHKLFEFRVSVYRNSQFTYKYHVNSFLAVSDPVVRVEGVPINGGFFTGQQLNLTCRVELDETVDSDVTVTTTWFRGGMLLDDTNRTRIFPAEQSDSNRLLYESIVVFSPLGQVDAGDYECRVDVTPNDATYIIPSNTTTHRTIEVGGD